MCPPSSTKPSAKPTEAPYYVTKKEFTRVNTEEPHKARRKEILAKHPEIKDLFGPDIRLLPSILALVVLQLSMSMYAVRLPYWQWFLLAYSAGGTLTHWLSLGNHELAHNLCFKATWKNELLGVVANFAQGLPSSLTFKKYHLEHHYYQGDDVIDMDLPTEWEGRVFNTTAKKVLWVFLQPFFYAFRPVIMNPKPPTVKEIVAFAAVIAFDFVFGYFFSFKAVFFNLLSLMLGMGLHPVAGHFIAEHYTIQQHNNQETFSYYGPLNYVAFNVGYHNEHHDFPRIPGFKLPQVRAMAPEYYDTLVYHTSWCVVIYHYITDPSVGPYSRVIRPHPADGKN